MSGREGRFKPWVTKVPGQKLGGERHLWPPMITIITTDSVPHRLECDINSHILCAAAHLHAG